MALRVKKPTVIMHRIPLVPVPPVVMRLPLFSLVPLACLLMLASGCSSGYAITEDRTTLHVGDRPVDVVVHQAEAAGLTFINVHDNEDTSVEAAREVLRQAGGRIVELQHTSERNITFGLPGEDSLYVFDPNRMFTDAGIRKTLEDLSRYTVPAHEAVRAFADSVLALYDLSRLGVVITLHNNTNDNYTALSYAPGGDYEDDARDTFVEGNSDPDDFFFVTDEALYEQLRAADFNAVLQDNEQATDDGSLSVYCGRRGIPYVNAEAQHGHVDQQVRMLTYLTELLQPSPL